jgi:hypothetical protein
VRSEPIATLSPFLLDLSEGLHDALRDETRAATMT